jgi:hypothetical protein
MRCMRFWFLSVVLLVSVGCSDPNLAPPPVAKPEESCGQFEKSWLPEALAVFDADPRMSSVTYGCSKVAIVMTAIVRSDFRNPSSRVAQWLEERNATRSGTRWLVKGEQGSFFVALNDWAAISGSDDPGSVEYRYGLYRGALGDGAGMAEITVLSLGA